MRPRHTAMACLALLFGTASPAAARGAVDLVHEEAVLRSPQTSVAAGAAIELNGSDFSGAESYRLRLLGVLDEYDLGDVEADSSGVFSLELLVPAEATPGAYQVVAIASDGDVVARLDITVHAATAGAPSGEMGADHGGGNQAEPVARHDDIRIERDRSGLEWGIIGLVIGLAGGIGLGLIRRTPA